MIPLSVVLFDRGANGAPTTSNPVNLAGRVESYEDAISDRYGFETARVAWTPTWAEIEEWARYDHLMRPMVAYSPDARQIWRGVLAEIEISIGTKKIAFSLKDMANRLTVRFSEPGGAQGESAAFGSAASQALFGIKDRVINASVALSAAASNQAQTILNYIAYPRSKQSSAAGTGRGDLGITLTFWGKYALLDWLLTSSTSTTSTATSTQIASLLASYAAINAFFSSSAANITATGVSDTEYIEPDTTYREKIERLCARGNSAQQPLSWGFYDDDAFVVTPRASASPSTITYYESEASGQIRDQWQNVLDVWDVRPNAMAQIVDLIDAPTPGSVETPFRKYVARVTRSVRGEDVTVTLEPDDTESLEDLLTSPAGAGPAGSSERQAAFERKITAPARSVFAGMDNATRYDRSQGVWKPAAGGTGKVNTGTLDVPSDGTIDLGGGSITNTGGGDVDVGTGAGIGGSGSLSETIDDRVAALLQAGNLISLTYNDAGNTLTIAVQSLSETIDDRVGALLAAGANVTLTYNDAGNTLTIAAADGAPTDARYWVSTSDTGLSAEVNLGALGSGLLKQTVSSGIATPALAVAGTDYVAPGTLAETIDDEVAGLLTAGNLISLTYNDTAGTLTIAVSSLNETIDDRVAALLQEGSGITITYNDTSNTLTIASSGVTGSGANKNVPYFTGANTLGDTTDFQYDSTNSTLTVRSQILAAGSGAGFYLDDRDGSGQWVTYVNSNIMRFNNGSADLVTIASTQVLPTGAGTVNLGNASQYWNDVSYKTLTDRGCLGWYDDGVELQDGRIVSDVEALKAIKPHPYRRTPAGAVRMDYSTLPKHVYRPAEIATEPVYGSDGQVLYRGGEAIGEDGAETTALIAMLIGAIKELDARIAALE